MEGLAPADFARILNRIPNATSHVPYGITHFERVSALLTYINSSAGPGQKQLEEVLRALFPDQFPTTSGEPRHSLTPDIINYLGSCAEETVSENLAIHAEEIEINRTSIKGFLRISPALHRIFLESKKAGFTYNPSEEQWIADGAMLVRLSKKSGLIWLHELERELETSRSWSLPYLRRLIGDNPDEPDEPLVWPVTSAFVCTLILLRLRQGAFELTDLVDQGFPKKLAKHAIEVASRKELWLKNNQFAKSFAQNCQDIQSRFGV